MEDQYGSLNATSKVELPWDNYVGLDPNVLHIWVFHDRAGDTSFPSRR